MYVLYWLAQPEISLVSCCTGAHSIAQHFLFLRGSVKMNTKQHVYKAILGHHARLTRADTCIITAVFIINACMRD